MILGLLRPRPGLRRVSRELPERLRRVNWPAGVTALGTYRRRGRGVPADEFLFRFRWPGADVSGSGTEAEAGRRLVAAGFVPDRQSGMGGFVFAPTAFFWDEARSRRMFVTCTEPGVVDLALQLSDGQPMFGALPLLFPPDNAELVQVGGVPQTVEFRSAQSVRTQVEGWCSQLAAQRWQEDGRLVAEWGAHAQFRSTATGQVLTFSLSVTGPGEWRAVLNVSDLNVSDLLRPADTFGP